MTAKHLFVLSVTVVTIAGLTLACNEAARFHALNFFFDGVPEPGAPAPDSDVKQEQEAMQGETESGPEVPDSTHPVVAVKQYFIHPPYKEFQCRRCHQPAGVDLVATPQEGLCARCHPGIPGDAPFVHGPVAVRDCLFCHHYHESAIPGMLLLPPDDTCLRCHDRDDLTTGSHHDAIDEQHCIACHDPHAGTVRYFLKRTDR